MPVRSDAPVAAQRPARVARAPLTRYVPVLVVLLALWMLLVVGRSVCLVAQRVPPLVWLVRGVRERLADRRQ